MLSHMSTCLDWVAQGFLKAAPSQTPRPSLPFCQAASFQLVNPDIPVPGAEDRSVEKRKKAKVYVLGTSLHSKVAAGGKHSSPNLGGDDQLTRIRIAAGGDDCGRSSGGNAIEMLLRAAYTY